MSGDRQRDIWQYVDTLKLPNEQARNLFQCLDSYQTQVEEMVDEIAKRDQRIAELEVEISRLQEALTHKESAPLTDEQIAFQRWCD